MVCPQMIKSTLFQWSNKNKRLSYNKLYCLLQTQGGQKHLEASVCVPVCPLFIMDLMT